MGIHCSSLAAGENPVGLLWLSGRCVTEDPNHPELNQRPVQKPTGSNPNPLLRISHFGKSFTDQARPVRIYKYGIEILI